ncbi:MAG: DUF4426 domain-containing protein [Gammaproteobacteria bacterium]|nr:DUF4426 domain-containing protein [Gammaproteobacteria bacterium]MCP5136407.1 DUF4426 domain-containing protein [Gammaproteobacteria bacterium]
MKNHKNPLLALLFLVLPLLLPSVSQAEQFQDFGDYVVHFNALPTSFLDPAVAKNYRIVRSKNRAMLNVTVLKKVMGTAGTPVRATVTASAKNLTDQLKDIEIKEVREGSAIYYIGEVRIANDETLDFTVNATPDGESEPRVVRFRQKFFTDF